MEANYAVKPGLATIMVPLLTLIQGGPAEAAARKKTRTDGERPEDVLLAPPVAHNVALHLLHLRAHAYVVSHWAVDSDRAVKLITKALAVMSSGKSIGRAASIQTDQRSCRETRARAILSAR